MDIDDIDRAILEQLSKDARSGQVRMASKIGLSATVIARRQKSLEDGGLIEGYRAVLDLGRFGFELTVLVKITLDCQSEEALKSFEEAIVECPSITRCVLLSGSDDYVAIVLAKDIHDFERIHRTELSSLPRVARMQSSFAIRDIVNRSAPPALFGRERARTR